MAIDPKLVSIKKAADLPSGIPTATGEFLYFEDETLMKAEMSDLYDRLESAYLGIITPSSTIPSTGSWYGTVLETGTFNNVSPAITVNAADFDVENGTANNEVRIIISDGVASKDVRRVKGEAGPAADPAKIPTWTPKTFASGSQVFHLGTVYESNKNTNLEPSLNSNDWNIISKEVVDSDNLLEFTDANGNILGSFDKFGNWIVKEIKEVKENPFINERLTQYKYFVFTNQEDQVIAEIDNTGKLTVNELEVRKEFNYKSKSSDSGSNELEITSETFVRLERPKFMRLEVMGVMPTDTSETRTPTNVEVTMKDGINVLLKFNAELAIQGTGSAGYLKKGYSIDLSNKDGAELKIKIGDMVTESSYHLKAFHTDITHTRDVGNSRLWAEMIATRPFPKNLVKPLDNTLLPLEQYNDKNIFLEDAKFYPDGIPCEIILNGSFYGLYTFRLKKTRENYKVNNLNENHIFIENMYTGVFMGIDTYTSWEDIEPKWEVRSPKTVTPTAKANILRMLNFWRSSMTGTYLRDNYADYIVLDSWIDFIIIAELVDHRDVAGNNTLLLTHDGQHWNINLYDTDNSIGIYGTLTNATNAFLITVDIWAKFKSTFETEIKARYTELRNKGVISNANFKKIYGGISENIPSSVYKQNYINWGCQTTNAIPTMQHLYKFLNDRMVWLDTQWKV